MMSLEEAHLKEREAEKSEAVAAIAEVVNRLETERRNPDAWERLCLVQAFIAVFHGAYRLALTDARLANTSANERSPGAAQSTEPLVAKCDTAFARNILTAAASEPVQPYPIFGKIEVR